MNPLLHPYTTKALSLAAKAHASQDDKQGMAFITHPYRVAIRFVDLYKQVASEFPSPELVAAAILHDTLEDCPISASNLLDDGFSIVTVEAVQVLTRKPDELYADYIKEIRHNSTPIILIKLADLEDNTAKWRSASVKPKHLAAQVTLRAEILRRTNVVVEV